MVGAAHQWSTLDVLEAELESVLAKVGELLWGVVAAHREVVLRGPQILADGQDVDFMLAQVAHGLVELLLHFPKAYHEAALRQTVRVDLLDVAEDFERTAVLRLWPDGRVETWDGLDVVVKSVGSRVDKRLYRLAVALKVWSKD